MQKYLNLMFKDLLICKKMLFFFIYGPIVLFFFPKEFMTVDILIYEAIFATFILLVAYVVEEEKNNGTELLLTTSYTRKDLIFSRFILCFCSQVFQITLSLLFVFIIFKKFKYTDLFSISYIFCTLCIVNSLLIPISFAVKAYLFSFISIFITIPFLFFLMFMATNNILTFIKINVNTAILLGITISIFFLVSSFLISKKIYLNKDL